MEKLKRLITECDKVRVKVKEEAEKLNRRTRNYKTQNGEEVKS